MLLMRRRCRLRSRRRELLLLVVVVFGLVIIAYYLMMNENDVEKQPPCTVSQEQRRRLYPLLSTVSSLLSRLSITHFLCYDSLWGAIQESGPLPWDVHAHLCALNEKVSVHDEAELLRAFRRRGLTLEYSSADGQYTIRNSTGETGNIEVPTVRVVLFEEDDRLHMLRRVGWRRRVLPPDCDAHPTLQCFPPNLAALPLPMRPFGPLSLPAPREDIDLLKFHYPDTWWRPLQPHC
ncbi:uncharacterized protein LOC121876530 [Homarus americanus]|uniref:Uncharacterized protein n=1 Tax=Homarus americanus TaxID=6706 RepID=A0A8J5MQL9_HOMAM|nr:uncharacterized protein LOC121876530 [Homarus americanus]KAG7160208.1 hypothetical protein Hamer_G012754 [Homarus americanus]